MFPAGADEAVAGFLARDHRPPSKALASIGRSHQSGSSHRHTRTSAEQKRGGDSQPAGSPDAARSMCAWRHANSALAILFGTALATRHLPSEGGQASACHASAPMTKRETFAEKRWRCPVIHSCVVCWLSAIRRTPPGCIARSRSGLSEGPVRSCRERSDPHPGGGPTGLVSVPHAPRHRGPLGARPVR